MSPEERAIVAAALEKRGRLPRSPKPDRLTSLMPGERIFYRDARGNQHAGIAATGVCHAHSFWVVWVTRCDPYDPSVCTPWPQEDVRRPSRKDAVSAPGEHLPTGQAQSGEKQQ